MNSHDDAPIGARRSVARWPGGRLFFSSTFTSTTAPPRFEMERAGSAEELVTTAPGERVRTQSVTAPNGEVSDVQPQQTALPYRFGTDDVTRVDLRSFARACDEAAEVLTDSKLDHLLSATGQIAEGLGQVGSAGGQQFGWPVLLLGLEQAELEFSSNGEPMMPRIVAENDKRHFVEYPPLTDADRPAFDELILEPESDHIPTFLCVLPTNPPWSERRILLVREPEWQQCWTVQFGRYMVFLPLEGDDGLYGRIATARSSGAEQACVSGTAFEWPDRPFFGMA